MEIDFSTAHNNLRGSTPPTLQESMTMLRNTLEHAGALQINVQENYVVLATLKALNDCGYQIHDGFKINLSRPIRKSTQTVLSVTHASVIQDLLISLANTPQAVADIAMASVKPDFDSYIVNLLIALAMANNARAVDGQTFKTIADELAFMTSLTVNTVGTGKDWGLPANSSLTTLVMHVLDYYHNAWYRRAWRWWISLFTPSQSQSQSQSQSSKPNLKPGPGVHDENTMEGK